MQSPFGMMGDTGWTLVTRAALMLTHARRRLSLECCEGGSEVPERLQVPRTSLKRSPGGNHIAKPEK